jgi:hypothetical protein
MTEYQTIDPSSHPDIHRGYIDIADEHLTVTITSEGIVIALYDDSRSKHIATLTNTFDEIAEIMTRLASRAAEQENN